MWPTTKIAPRCRRCERPLSLTCRPGKSPQRFEATCPRCGRVLVLTLGVRVVRRGHLAASRRQHSRRNDGPGAPIPAEGYSAGQDRSQIVGKLPGVV